MTITLITGGCGFIGSYLVKKLVADNRHVRVLDNCDRGAARRINDVINKVEFIQGDIRDPSIVNSCCKDVSRIHHLAYINGTQNFYKHPDLVLDVAASGILNLYNAIKDKEVKEFFLASTSEVYQYPTLIPTPEDERLIVPDVHNSRYTYGGGKIFCELMALHAISKHVDKTIVYRPHNVYGADMGEEHVLPQFFRRMYSQANQENSSSFDFEIQGQGTETRAFIHISDFIEALMKIEDLGVNKEVYHIGNSEEISISEVVNLVASELGLKVNIKAGPLTKGSTNRRCPEITKISLLGYKQKVSLKEGISSLREWYTK